MTCCCRPDHASISRRFRSAASMLATDEWHLEQLLWWYEQSSYVLLLALLRPNSWLVRQLDNWRLNTWYCAVSCRKNHCYFLQGTSWTYKTAYGVRFEFSGVCFCQELANKIGWHQISDKDITKIKRLTFLRQCISWFFWCYYKRALIAAVCLHYM